MSALWWHRAGAASGPLFVLLQFAGFGIGGATRGFERVTLTSSEPAVVEATSAALPSVVWLGGYVEVLAYLVFAVFVAWLTATLRASEPGPGWASMTVLAGGLLAVATSFVGYSTEAAAYYRAGQGIEVGVARALLDTGNFAFVLAWGGLAIFLAGAAAVSLRTGGLPRWLGLLAVLLATAFLVALGLPESVVGEIADLVLWLWVLAVSIVLFRRPGPPLSQTRTVSS